MASHPPQSEENSGSRTFELVRAALDGDRRRFDDLCVHLMPAVLHWAELALGPSWRGRVDPQDIAQVTWLRAWRDLEKFDPLRGPFRRWLFAIAKHVLVEALRDARRARLERSGGTSWMAVLEDLPAQRTAIVKDIAKRESAQQLSEFITTLDDEEQRLLRHCGLEGLTCAEYARRFGPSEAAANKRWQRLRARLALLKLPADLLQDPIAG